MKKTRFLIADDHAIVRDGIRLVLASIPEYTIVAEANDGEEAIQLAQEYKPDIVIMDISMPRLNGIDATAVLRKEHPGIKIVILTVHDSEEYIHQILRAGANGYVLKNAGKKEILAAIKSALSGGRFFSPGVSNVIMESFIKRQGEVSAFEQINSKRDDTLTNREAEILQYIVQGHTNRQIAEKLVLSIRTINTHRTNLMQKLNIHETASLVRYAIETGLVQLKSPDSSLSPIQA